MVLAASVIAVATAGLLAEDAPDKLVHGARERMAEARAAGAADLAPAQFREAEIAWDSTRSALRRVAQDAVVFRSYESVRRWATRTETAADAALARTGIVADSLDSRFDSDLDALRQRWSALGRAASYFPPGQIDADRIADARVALDRAESANERAHRGEAARFLKAAAATIEAQETAAKTLEADLARRGMTLAAAKRTLRDAGGYPHILVDKAGRRLFVLGPGGTTREFDIELGREWIGHKSHEGDRRTPEGLYRVIRHKTGADTRYHRALLLDYPNQSDQTRFRSAVSTGSIPRTARIGGLIEIHGGGGKAADWTDGCVALTNPDMERLYALVPSNTPVLIVPALIDD